MKKITIILGLFAISLTSCMKKKDYAPVQDNGLNYEFIDYIGPDSCKLYSCAFHRAGSDNAGMVYLTICKDKQVETNWVEQHGKSSVLMTNTVTSDTTITMVPETTIVTRKK